MKTFKKVLIILLVIVVIGFLGFKLAANKLISDAKALTIEEIDLSNVKDGEYLGNYEIFPVKVSVKTTVKNGEITQIELLEHFNGKGAAAEKITDYIIEKQSLQIDAVSGATVSSIAIKKAVEDSLIGK